MTSAGGILGALAGLMCVLVVVPLAVLLQALLLRVVCVWVADERPGLGVSVITVLVAAFAQGLASGCAGGADAGLVGALVGFVAWSGMTSLMVGMPFVRAMLVGLVMAFIQWALSVALVLAGLSVLFAGLLAALALA